MTYEKHQQSQEAKNRRSQRDRELHLRKMASARLKPFDWSDENLGIRRKDVGVFQSAARVFDHIILVRSTNPASLVYIDNQHHFCPKPIDCKVKTADRDVYVDKLGIQVKSAGLVVNPELLGVSVFSNTSKYQKSIEEWNKFTQDNPQISKNLFDRRGARKGFFAVENFPGNRYGCLMVSDQNVPDRYFNMSVSAFQEWKNRHMRYIHGDYDLYAIIDSVNPSADFLENEIFGVRNYYSPILEKIRDFVNGAIGAPMIQHGEQFLYRHQDDVVLVFYPGGDAYYFKEPAVSIEEIFKLLYNVK